MKKSDVRIGGRYEAKVSGRITVVEIRSESPHGGWNAMTVDTRRAVRVRTAQRLRRPASAVEWDGSPVDTSRHYEDEETPIETTEKRTVLVHLNVEVPESDTRTANEIADAIEAAFQVGSDDDSVCDLDVVTTLAEEV